MRRGHVYVIERDGAEVRVLVISADEVNNHIGGATVVQIFPAGSATPSLLAVPIARPLPGTVVTDRFQTFAASYFDRGFGPVDAADLEAVEIGVRTVLGL